MDEQLYLLAIGLSLDEKVEKAIANLRHYEPEALRRDPVNGYYNCNSYGKDSGVVEHLCKKAGVRYVSHHNLTTLDPPELIYFGREHHPDTIIHKPDIPLLRKMVTKSCGPPTRLARWCCEYYKEGSGQDYVRVFGVRAAESAKRKANWKVWHPWYRRKADQRNGWVLNPILYWTDNDVWRYTKRERIHYCSLYDEGWSRLGCIGCPMSRKGRERDFARWPKYERAWKRAFQQYWAAWGDTLTDKGDKRWFQKRGLKSWQELWAWWMEELPELNKEDDCQMGLW